MLDFKSFYEMNVPGGMGDTAGGAFLTSDFTGSEVPEKYLGRSPSLPSTDLQLPSVTKSGRIVVLEKNKNPIFIQLSDGTKMYFTYDEFKRIAPISPEIGRTIVVSLQRHPKTPNDIMSQIENIKCY